MVGPWLLRARQPSRRELVEDFHCTLSSLRYNLRVGRLAEPVRRVVDHLQRPVLASCRSNNRRGRVNTLGSEADDVNGLDEAAEQPVDTQDLLFDGDFSPMPETSAFVARSPAVLPDHPIKTRLLGSAPAGGARGFSRPGGSGTQRLYSFRDILLLKVIKRLIDAGISLQQIRTAVDHLRARGVQTSPRSP